MKTPTKERYLLYKWLDDHRDALHGVAYPVLATRISVDIGIRVNSQQVRTAVLGLGLGKSKASTWDSVRNRLSAIEDTLQRICAKVGLDDEEPGFDYEEGDDA